MSFSREIVACAAAAAVYPFMPVVALGKVGAFGLSYILGVSITDIARSKTIPLRNFLADQIYQVEVVSGTYSDKEGFEIVRQASLAPNASLGTLFQRAQEVKGIDLRTPFSSISFYGSDETTIYQDSLKSIRPVGLKRFFGWAHVSAGERDPSEAHFTTIFFRYVPKPTPECGIHLFNPKRGLYVFPTRTAFFTTLRLQILSFNTCAVVTFHIHTPNNP